MTRRVLTEWLIWQCQNFWNITLQYLRVIDRSVKLMDRINKVVRWKNIEALLLEYYDTGKTLEGADVLPR